MDRLAFMKKIESENIGRCVYKESINVLMIGPFDLEKKQNMWTIVENVERKGETVVFETEDESVALEKLYELVKEYNLESSFGLKTDSGCNSLIRELQLDMKNDKLDKYRKEYNDILYTTMKGLKK